MSIDSWLKELLSSRPSVIHTLTPELYFYIYTGNILLFTLVKHLPENITLKAC